VLNLSAERVNMAEEGINEEKTHRVIIATKRGVEAPILPVVTFSDIHKRIIDEDTSEEERRHLQEEREKIVKEVEELGILRWRDIRAEVLKRLKENKWDNVYPALMNYARDEENVTRGTNVNLPNREKYNGIVQSAIEMAALDVSTQGMKRRSSDPDFEYWIVKHGKTPKELEEDEQIMRWGKIIDFRGVDLPDLVGESLKKEEEAEELTTRGVKSAEQFTPENFAKALGVASPEDQMDLYRRAEEALIPFAISVGNEPKFWPHIEATEQREWEARAILTTAAANKRQAPSSDKLIENDEAISFSRDKLQPLIDKKGVLYSLSVYTALICDKGNPRVLLDNDAPEELLNALPQSVLEIKGGGQLNAIREAMRYWLEKKQGLSEDEALDAEQISWNLIYLSNLIEHRDSKEFQEEGLKRLAPISGLKSLPVWMMMHPQERLEAKLRQKEAWSVFGEWALKKKLTSSWKKEDDEILPAILFTNLLADIKLSAHGSLEDLLLKNGKSLLDDPKREIERINWDKPGDAPFADYYFDTINPAITIFSVITSGAQRDKNLTALGNACRKLNLDYGYREKLLMAWNGINAGSSKLRAAMSGTDWMFYVGQLKRTVPNFFE